MGKSDMYNRPYWRQRGVMIVHVRLATLTPIPEETNEETRRNERGAAAAPGPSVNRHYWSRMMPMREEEPEPGPSGLPDETPTRPNANPRDENEKPT